MSENLYCGTHKSSNPKSRKGYDDIEWDGNKNKVACVKCGLVHGCEEGSYECPRCIRMKGFKTLKGYEIKE